MFSYPDGSSAGNMILNGRKPNGTKFVIRNGKLCYSVVAEYSSSSLFDLQLSLDQTLSDICESSGSFVTEDNCCTDKSAKVVMFGGKSESQYGIETVGHPSGVMDGILCWDAPEPEFAMANFEIVSFEGRTGEFETIQLKLTTPTDGIKFTYLHKDGDCYEGFITPNNTTFTLIQ